MHFKIVMTTALALCLCGCAAKQVVPVSMVQSGDDGLTCEAIKQQMTDNKAAGKKYWKKDKDTANANTAKAIAGAIPYAGLLFIGSSDLSSEDQIKARALSDRNEHLAYLAQQKGCKE